MVNGSSIAEGGVATAGGSSQQDTPITTTTAEPTPPPSSPQLQMANGVACCRPSTLDLALGLPGAGAGADVPVHASLPPLRSASVSNPCETTNSSSLAATSPGETILRIGSAPLCRSSSPMSPRCRGGGGGSNNNKQMAVAATATAALAMNKHLTLLKQDESSPMKKKCVYVTLTKKCNGQAAAAAVTTEDTNCNQRMKSKKEDSFLLSDGENELSSGKMTNKILNLI